MFFRTKHLVILIATILLCIVSSVSYWTITSQGGLNNSASVIVAGFSDTEVDYMVDKTQAVDINQKKKERLDQLSKKIAELDISKITEEEVIAEVVDKDEQNDQNESSVTSIQLCSGYRVHNGPWSSSGLKFEVVEGARLLTREGGVVPEVILQLPIYTNSLENRKCLETDVVGIAMDGSLIRNSDYTVYSIFGSETIIGYALDGFPIYGLSNDIKSDICGGVQSGGGYGYYLSEDREGVIACFSGNPVSF